MEAPEHQSYAALARRAALTTLVVLGIVVAALALWKIRLVIALLFSAVIIAAAMRPGVEWLHRRRIPRAAGVLLHYGLLLALIAGALWLIVPQALDQVTTALSPSGSNSARGRAPVRARWASERSRSASNSPA